MAVSDKPKSPDKRILALLVLLLFLGFYWAGRFEKKKQPAPLPVVVQKEKVTAPNEPARQTRAPREAEEIGIQIEEGLEVEIFASTQPQQIIFRFPDDFSYRAFVSDVRGTRVKLLAQLDPLRAMRLGFDDPADIDRLLAQANVTRYASLPSLPEPPPAFRSEQQGLMGFGDLALRWLGAADARGKWGAGVRVAVIDNGIEAHSGLPALAAEIDVSAKPGSWKNHAHGTGVASLIAGRHPRAPGVAPGVTLISINVFDDTGRADAFALAAGLLAAIDQRADLVNISLGSDEDNPLTREAVAMAQKRGIVIVAAAGNSARAHAAFPAAYPDVISVGAVDAKRVPLEFSNHGDALGITAPGYLVSAAFPGDRLALVSGTSVSAPLVTGAIAATMANDSPFRLSSDEAARLVLSHADEAGIPGPDSQYGDGVLNIGRVMNRNRPGVADAAITWQEVTGSGVQVTVQNRGTIGLVNLKLEVTALQETKTLNITTLLPRAVQTFSVPFVFRNGAPPVVTSAVHTGANGVDPTPANNVLTKKATD